MQSIYSDQRTWLHSVSAGLKLLAVMCLGVGLYVTSNQLLLSIAFVCCVLVYASLGRVGWRARRLLMPLLLACLLVVLVLLIWRLAIVTLIESLVGSQWE